MIVLNICVPFNYISAYCIEKSFACLVPQRGACLRKDYGEDSDSEIQDASTWQYSNQQSLGHLACELLLLT